MGKIAFFEDLEVWQQARLFAKDLLADGEGKFLQGISFQGTDKSFFWFHNG